MSGFIKFSYSTRQRFIFELLVVEYGSLHEAIQHSKQTRDGIAVLPKLNQANQKLVDDWSKEHIGILEPNEQKLYPEEFEIWRRKYKPSIGERITDFYNNLRGFL